MELFVEDLSVENLSVENLSGPDEPIILDIDATDDPLHGKQEEAFFHGYYDCYCYLPLYIFCGEELLCAKLRRSNIDPSEGTLPEVKRLVERVREKWPKRRASRFGDSKTSSTAPSTVGAKGAEWWRRPST